MAISGCQPVLSLPRAHGDGTGSTVGLQWLNRHCSPWLLFSCRQEKAAALPGWVATVCHQCLTKMTPRFKKTPNHRTPRKAPLPKSSAGFTQPGPSLSQPTTCAPRKMLLSTCAELFPDFFFLIPQLFLCFFVYSSTSSGPSELWVPLISPSCQAVTLPLLPLPAPAESRRGAGFARCHRPSATEPQLAPAACRDRHASPPPAPWPEQLRG